MSSHQWPGRALECVQYLCVCVCLVGWGWAVSPQGPDRKRITVQLFNFVVYLCSSSFCAAAFNICYSASDILVVCWFFFTYLFSLSLRVESGGGVGAVYLQYQWWSNEQTTGARAVLQLSLRLVLCICCQLFPAQRGQRMKFQSKISMPFLVVIFLLRVNSSPLALNGQDVVIFLVKASMTWTYPFF